MFGKRVVLPLVAACSVLLLALGCQQAAAPQPPAKAGEPPAQKPAAAVATATKLAEKPVRGGTLRTIQIREPITMDPHARSSSPYLKLAYDFLIGHNQDLDITKEGLFKDWTVGADGKSVTFKLREGVKFHDGTDFDGAAVKFNIERQKDPATQSPYRTDYANLNVEVVDSLTVRFNLSGPDPLLLTRLSTAGSHIVSPAAVKKYGSDFPRYGGGTGAFQLAEWVPGSHITFKRFEGYWRKDKDGVQLPYLEQVVNKVTPDLTVAFANFRIGQADYFDGVTEEQLPLLKSEPNLTYTVQRFSGLTGVYLNTKRPPFDNKALRQAVALAVDREGIAARLGERATLQASILHPMTWAFGAYDNKTALFPGRDLAKAKAKLAEAGYAGGLKAKFTSSNAEETLLVGQIVKANLAEIGIDMELEVVSATAHTSMVRVGGKEQNYQMSVSSIGNGVADPGAVLHLALPSKGGRNYYGPYSNTQVDQLLAKAGSIYDQKERAALYQEAAKIVADDVPFLPLYVPNNINGLSKKVRNWVPYPDNHARLTEVWLAP